MSLSFFHLSTDREMFTFITACFCQFKHNTWAVKAAVSVVCLIHAQLSDMTSIMVPPEDCLRTEPGGAAPFSLVWSFFLRSRHDIIVIRFPNSCRNPVALEWTMDIAASAALQTSCAWMVRIPVWPNSILCCKRARLFISHLPSSRVFWGTRNSSFQERQSLRLMRIAICVFRTRFASPTRGLWPWTLI